MHAYRLKGSIVGHSPEGCAFSTLLYRNAIIVSLFYAALEDRSRRLRYCVDTLKWALQVVRNIVDVIQGFLNETLAQPYSPELPNLSAYERTFFEDLLRHAACMLLLARREAAAIIADLRLVRRHPLCACCFAAPRLLCCLLCRRVALFCAGTCPLELRKPGVASICSFTVVTMLAA